MHRPTDVKAAKVLRGNAMKNINTKEDVEGDAKALLEFQMQEVERIDKGQRWCLLILTTHNSLHTKYPHTSVSRELHRPQQSPDVMFNNAGMTFNEGSIMEMDVYMANKLVSVNVNGVLHGIKHAAKAMIKGGGGGSIICTSSSSGIMGGLGGHAYTLSKGAINGLVRTTACELGSHGIRVNSISPHGVPTDILVNAYRKYLNNDKLDVPEVTDIVAEKGSLPGRAGAVEDVAQAALFLASQESSGFITGHNLVVDGGYTSATSTMKFIYN
ncbi:PREDICTED: short-chain dehydrogenase reductase ATA1-like [Camelina sativa]|uniref:Short-chain dehydrogenase reductase ATA1-like n=1 Tax=Camelina sativa TaxID=90675 RepID=A0ABM0SKI9_CAMSA|nr:PREDICTED: short-chain dehydrogenase reductase ATA1-like [Camelina sativa]